MSRTVSIGARRARMCRPWPRHRLPRTHRMQQPIRWLRIALLAAATYYAGAHLGFALTFPSSALSIIWPPNAFLFVVLMLIPPRIWWVALLAVAPAHLLVAWQYGLPATASVGLYVTNCAEALLAAALVRRFADGPPWLVGLRRMVVYVGGAVIVAPLVTSFLDARVQVATGLGHDYWLLWWERLLSDALTFLTVPPALLVAASSERGRLRWVSPLRVLEAALLVVGLLAAGFVVFGPLGLRPIAQPTIVYETLPLLLWAALRFGVGGTSAALLGVTLLASIWSANQGTAPSGTSSSVVHHILMLQAQLLAMSIPVLWLAAVIQERRQAQQALRQSWEHYRAFFDLTAVGASEANPATGQFLRVNDAYCQITGYSREEMLRLSFRDLTHPEDREEDWQGFHRAVEAGVPTWRVEKRYVRKDGQTILVRVDSTIVRDETGQPIYTATIIQDITERKQMEKALRASEARYRDLVETQTEMICRYLPDGTLTFVNGAYCRHFGRSHEELIGLPFPELLPTAQAERARAGLASHASLAQRPAIVSDEHEVALADGRLGWQQWVEHPIYDAHGQVVEMQAIGRDTTERKRAEEALRESEKRFRAAFESAAIGMILVDTSGRPLQANRPTSAMLGYSEEELRTLPFAEFTYPDDLEGNLVLFRQALAGEIDSYHLEKRFIHKQGHVVWGHLSAGVVRDDAGNPLYLVVQVQDITERKRLEQEREEARAEAERKSEELDRVFETMADGVVVFDAQGHIVRENAAMRRLVGIDAAPSDYYQRSLSERMDLFAARDVQGRPLQPDEGPLPRVLRGEVLTGAESMDLRSCTLDGRELVLTLSVAPLREREGRLVGAVAIFHDQTERTQMEQALRASEARYRAVVQTQTELICRVAPDTTITFVNEAMGRYLGKSQEELVGTRYIEQLPESIRPRVEANIQALLMQPHVLTAEQEFTLPDGSLRWMHWVVQPILDADGRVVELQGSGRDITERKQLEREREAARAEAEQQAEQLDRIFEQMGEGLAIYDAQGQIVQVNAAQRRLLGLDAAPPDYFQTPLPQRIGSHVVRDRDGNPVPPDDWPVSRALRGETVAGAEAVDMHLHTLDGRDIEVTASAAPLRTRDGRIIGAVGVVHDQTKRRRGEQALRASEERYRAVVETQTELIDRYLPDTTITFVNDAYCRYYGTSPEEVLGTRFIETLSESARPRVEAAIQSLVAHPGVVTVEHEFVLPDGSVRWQQWVNRAILDTNGHVAELQGIGRDITERKQAEEALECLTARLLQVQDEERRRLARDLHDGTAQTLTALDLNLTTLQGFAGGGVRDLDRFVHLLADSQALAEQAMREMRTMSYLLHPPELDEAGLVPAVQSYVQGFSCRSGIRVDLVAPKDLGRLPIEVERALFRVIQECLTNVHRHSGSSTARIALKRAASAVHLRVVDAGRGLGAGAPAGPEELYSEVNVLGVGIPGMRQRLRQLGGRLSIRSIQQGTMVMAMVPIQGEALRGVRTPL